MKLTRLFAIPLAALLLTSCTTSSRGGGGGGGGGGGSYTPGEIENGAYDGYYDLKTYNLNKYTGPELIREIHRMMLDTHHTLVRYAQFTQYTKATADREYSVDQVDAATKKNQFFYTGSENSLSTSYTREHVWPCASSGGMWVHKNYTDIKYYVDHSAYVGGGSDLYHVRPCNSHVNTARGDSKFVEFTADEKKSMIQEKDSGAKYVLLCDADEYSNYSEPADEFKGDVARIIFYVYVHYAKIGNYNWDDYCGALNLKDVIGKNGSTKEEIYDQLIRWNNIDPVSETEKLRNNTVQTIQGNRNPFVDYPSLLDRCLVL